MRAGLWPRREPRRSLSLRDYGCIFKPAGAGAQYIGNACGTIGLLHAAANLCLGGEVAAPAAESVRAACAPPAGEGCMAEGEGGGRMVDEEEGGGCSAAPERPLLWAEEGAKRRRSVGRCAQWLGKFLARSKGMDAAAARPARTSAACSSDRLIV